MRSIIAANMDGANKNLCTSNHIPRAHTEMDMTPVWIRPGPLVLLFWYDPLVLLHGDLSTWWCRSCSSVCMTAGISLEVWHYHSSVGITHCPVPRPPNPPSGPPSARPLDPPPHHNLLWIPSNSLPPTTGPSFDHGHLNILDVDGYSCRYS